VTAPRYLIFGPQGSGKTTFGRILAAAIGTTATDTSAWLKRVEMRRNGGKPFTRADLVALGDAVCAEDPAFLVDRCFEAGRVAVGVRRWSEFAAVHVKYPGVVDIYIDRAPGAEVADDNFELRPDHADHIITPCDEAQAVEFALHIARYEGEPV